MDGVSTTVDLYLSGVEKFTGDTSHTLPHPLHYDKNQSLLVFIELFLQ